MLGYPFDPQSSSGVGRASESLVQTLLEQGVEVIYLSSRPRQVGLPDPVRPELPDERGHADDPTDRPVWVLSEGGEGGRGGTVRLLAAVDSARGAQLGGANDVLSHSLLRLLVLPVPGSGYLPAQRTAVGPWGRSELRAEPGAAEPGQGGEPTGLEETLTASEARRLPVGGPIGAGASALGGQGGRSSPGFEQDLATVAGTRPPTVHGSSPAGEPTTEQPDDDPDAVLRLAERYRDWALELCGRTVVDVVHAHDWLSFPAALALKAQTHAALVVHIHSTELERRNGLADQRIYDAERQACHYANAVVAVSEVTRDVLVQRYRIAWQKIRVVHPGSEPGIAEPALQSRTAPPVGGAAADGQPADGAAAAEPAMSRQASALEQCAASILPGEAVILFAGRLERGKGVDVFLDALELVAARHQAVRALIAGTGSLTGAMLARCSQGLLGGRVLMLGHLASEPLEVLYRRADVFVLASEAEPFGLSCVEAARAGAAVILPRGSGAAEVLPNCLLVDPGDSAALAGALLGVLRHPPLRDGLREQASISLRKLDTRETGRAMVEIYESVLPPPRGVLFDVGYCLMDETARLRAALAWMSGELGRLGVLAGESELWSAYHAACERPDRTEPSLIVQVGVAMGLDRSQAQEIRRRMPWDAVRLSAYADVRSSLERLRSSRLKVGVLANQPASAAAELEREGITSLCDDVWLSDTVGLSKPDPRLFQLALDAWGLAADAVVYVGDRPDNDIGPARRLGMQALRIRIGPHAGQAAADAFEVADFEAHSVSEAVDHLLVWARTPRVAPPER